MRTHVACVCAAAILRVGLPPGPHGDSQRRASAGPDHASAPPGGGSGARAEADALRLPRPASLGGPAADSLINQGVWDPERLSLAPQRRRVRGPCGRGLTAEGMEVLNVSPHRGSAARGTTTERASNPEARVPETVLATCKSAPGSAVLFCMYRTAPPVRCGPTP